MESKTEGKHNDDVYTSEAKTTDVESKTSSTGKRKISEEDKTIIERAMAYCFSREFLKVFEDFIRDNAYIFYPAVEEEEHRLEYTDSFNEYLVVFENTMEDWLATEGITLKEFFKKCQAAQEQGAVHDKYFMKLLLASAEYDCFFDVMVKEARKQVAQRA